jgi:hypothetical protein
MTVATAHTPSPSASVPSRSEHTGAKSRPTSWPTTGARRASQLLDHCSVLGSRLGHADRTRRAIRPGIHRQRQVLDAMAPVAQQEGQPLGRDRPTAAQRWRDGPQIHLVGQRFGARRNVIIGIALSKVARVEAHVHPVLVEADDRQTPPEGPGLHEMDLAHRWRRSGPRRHVAKALEFRLDLALEARSPVETREHPQDGVEMHVDREGQPCPVALGLERRRRLVVGADTFLFHDVEGGALRRRDPHSPFELRPVVQDVRGAGDTNGPDQVLHVQDAALPLRIAGSIDPHVPRSLDGHGHQDLGTQRQ